MILGISKGTKTWIKARRNENDTMDNGRKITG